MMCLTRPSDETVERFLREQASLPFSYPEVGATAATPPAGYAVDRYSERLGHGEATFARACDAIDAWKVYPSSWFRVYRDGDAAPRPDLTFVTRIHHLGVWSLNSGRVIAVVDERKLTSARHGFSFGTLPGHEEQGEESFQVTWDRATDEVTYRVVAFSRPRGRLTRLGYPVVRLLQKRFAHDTCAAMRSAAAKG